MVQAWATMAAGQPLERFEYDAGPLGPEEVEVAVETCGICHSDLSVVNNEWGISSFPAVPGHEVIGRVAALGAQAKGLSMGQLVGIGWSAESCMHCTQCLAGDGPREVMEVVFELAVELAQLAGNATTRRCFEALVDSGQAREAFIRWAESQGADQEWLVAPTLEPAPHEIVCEASCNGYLSQVANREFGLLLAEASHPDGASGTLDEQVSLRYETRLGDSVEAGQVLARLFLRRPDRHLAERFRACFKIADEAVAPVLIRDRISAA